MAWDRDSINALLDRSDVAVERALLRLYERQTDAEQSAERTVVHNSVGFTALDGAIFSSFAQQILSSRRPEGYRLSPRQIAICRKRDARGVMKLGKYWKQLAEVIVSRQPVSAAKAPEPQPEQ